MAVERVIRRESGGSVLKNEKRNRGKDRERLREKAGKIETQRKSGVSKRGDCGEIPGRFPGFLCTCASHREPIQKEQACTHRVGDIRMFVVP